MSRHAKTVPRILVADDDDDIRNLLKSVVRDKGFEVIEAANGREASEAASRVQFDLFILDLAMPEQDGFTTARLIRQAAGARPVPIIFITGYGDKGIELYQNIGELGEGPLEYIAKPNILESLNHLLKHFFPDGKE
jgi:CheY-like chemotaxis protein